MYIHSLKFSCSKSYEDFPCSHRQWRHEGHCRLVHGYSRSFTFWFTAIKLDLNGLIIRKEIKKYGTKAGIEGPTLEEGTLVTVLEDVVTTAGSVIKAIKKLRENNYLVEEVLSIVDRQEGGLEALEDENVKLKSLFTIKDFL